MMNYEPNDGLQDDEATGSEEAELEGFDTDTDAEETSDEAASDEEAEEGEGEAAW